MGSTRARIVVLVLLAALGARGHARATPAPRPPTRSVDPAMVAAETAWQTAEATRDAADAAVAWKAAAIAFGQAADATTGTDRNEALYAAVLAWRNAINIAPPTRAPPGAPPPPLALEPDEAAMLAAIAKYLPVARTDEVAALRFTQGMVLRRHGRHDEVTPIMIELVTRHAADEVAEYAANILLDTLNQQAKFADLLAWTARLRGDRTLLAGRPDLARTLDTIHVQGQRKAAEAAAASGDAAGFARCATIYQQVLRDVRHPERADELLFNGATCAARGGAFADARARYRALLKRFPRSPLAAATRARLEALRGR